MTVLRSGSATDVGRRRRINQDMVLEAEPLFAVADGMGGPAGGEVAARTAIETLRQSFADQASLQGLEDAVRAANRAVYEQARGSGELRDMGTTLIAVALVQSDGGEGDVLALANVGDSRAYLLRQGELSQLTDDHSVPWDLYRRGELSRAEAEADPRRNILTRVLGPIEHETPDMLQVEPVAGDRLLLCSDGLYTEVGDNEIARVLRTEPDPRQAARELVALANAHGGSDNISAIVVDVVDDDGRAEVASAALADDRPRPAAERTGRLMTVEERNSELRRMARDEPVPGSSWAPEEPSEVDLPARRVTVRVVAFVVVLALVVGGAAVAIGYYARGSYFVGLDDGRVAIFKGRPGGLLWFQPTVVETTGMTEAQVPPSRIDDVQAGHEAATLGDARRYVRNLRALAGASGDDEPAPTSTTLPPTSAPA